MGEAARFGNRIALVVILASLGVLGGAFYLQHIEGLAPCVLCIWQRWPYAAAIGLGMLAWLLIRQHERARGHNLRAAVPLLLCGLAFLAGAAIAGFHVGVEQKWWDGLPDCSGSFNATDLEGLKRELLAAPVVRCDEIAWRLLGISLAGYNVAISVGLAAISLIAARRLWRGDAVD